MMGVLAARNAEIDLIRDGLYEHGKVHSYVFSVVCRMIVLFGFDFDRRK